MTIFDPSDGRHQAVKKASVNSTASDTSFEHQFLALVESCDVSVDVAAAAAALNDKVFKCSSLVFMKPRS